MKRIVLSLLAIVGIFFLTGCGCEKIEYEVTFSNDGARTVLVVDKDEAVEKPADPVKEGYVFLGWFKNLADTEAYDFESKVTENIILYAKWVKEEKACTLTCDEGYTLNSVTCTCEKDEVEEPEVEKPVMTEKFTVKFDAKNGSKATVKTVTSGNKVKEPSAPTKDGYKFLGWYLDGKEYNFKNKVIKNMTLVAKWEKVVVEEPKEETPTTPSTPTTPETPTVKDPVLGYKEVEEEGSAARQIRIYITKDGEIVAGSADIVYINGKTVNVKIPKTGIQETEGIYTEIKNIKVD
ncbi:MAG: InlB B-repeat-containing protein [Bacilli bacterium]|nr:InlB B-repeat-containing protein [Bacilli bacterium]